MRQLTHMTWMDATVLTLAIIGVAIGHPREATVAAPLGGVNGEPSFRHAHCNVRRPHNLPTRARLPLALAHRAPPEGSF